MSAATLISARVASSPSVSAVPRTSLNSKALRRCPGRPAALGQERSREEVQLANLSAVFDLVMWWAAEGRAISRARWALQIQGADLPSTDEPFAAIILATADRERVDKRTRSKWSRMLRYAAEYKTNSELLAAFVRRKGGINKCAARFTRGARRSKLSVELYQAWMRRS
jgi:hypothetical protein